MAKKDIKPPVVSLIYWDDAFIDTDDFDKKDGRKTQPVKRATIGFLVEETDDGVVLATDYFRTEEGEFSGRLFVGWGMITEYYEIKIP